MSASGRTRRIEAHETGPQFPQLQKREGKVGPIRLRANSDRYGPLFEAGDLG